MSKLGFLFISLIVGLVATSIAALRTVDRHISTGDLDRFKTVFFDGFSSQDLQSNYYGALNYPNPTPQESNVVCVRLPKLFTESKLNDFEKNFYFVGIFRHLKCKLPIPKYVEDVVKESLNKEFNTAHEIYFNYFATKALTEKDIPEETKVKLVKNLQTILKKDDSLNSLGYSFNVVADMGGNHGQAIADRIEDALAQADEVDGKMLQFEGGLSTTALIVNGALRLTKVLKKPSPINEEQAVKLANYFLSRRSVQTAKGASVLLEVLTTLSQSSVTPVCIQVIGNGQIQPENPSINLKIVDLDGKALTSVPASITGTVTPKKTPTTPLISNQAFSPKSSDKTVFSLDLAGAKATAGIYTVDVVAGSYKQSLTVKVLGKVKVSLLEVGVGDSDSASALKKHSVKFPQKLSEKLLADGQQKIVLKTLLVDENTLKPLSVHQVFVRFEHQKTKEEIIFVAESDTTKHYKFDLDLSLRAGDFGHKSGDYIMELIVGDAALSNSFKWHVADIQFKFGEETKTIASQSTPVWKPKPEISHLFREPEKRPPRFFSDLFTALCAAPLIILIGFWIKLKVNISNFPASLSALGFHIGLGAILFLFFVFWVQLNMFETIRYLLPLALFTFICGNRLLRSIANRKTT